MKVGRGSGNGKGRGKRCGKTKVEAGPTLKVAGDAEGTGGFWGLNTVILWGLQDSDARCRRTQDVSGVQGASQG